MLLEKVGKNFEKKILRKKAKYQMKCGYVNFLITDIFFKNPFFTLNIAGSRLVFNPVKNMWGQESSVA